MDSLQTRDTVLLGDRRWELHRLDQLAVDHLPFTLKVLLENLLRHEDGQLVTGEQVELDLSSVVASLAGPRRPQDRVPLTAARAAFRAELGGPPERADRLASWVDEASQESFPASDAPAIEPDLGADPPAASDDGPTALPAVEPGPAVEVVLEGRRHRLGHGAVAIAAITSYVRRPPHLDGMPAQPRPLPDIVGARVLVKLGDSITTDHISPAGAIPRNSDAGRHLASLGVPPGQLNTFASRRGNHEVMARGAFQRAPAEPARPRDRRRRHPLLRRRRWGGVDLPGGQDLPGAQHAGRGDRRQGLRRRFLP